MKKILRLQSALLKEIDKYEKLVPERSHFIDWERVHITSCAKIGYMLAEERGVDPILAAAACAVHDYGLRCGVDWHPQWSWSRTLGSKH